MSLIKITNLLLCSLIMLTGCIAIDSTSTNIPTPISFELKPTRFIPTSIPLSDGKLIVFGTQIIDAVSSGAKEQTISVVDINNLLETQLTSATEFSSFASWSPDGTRLAFNISSPDSGDQQLYIMNKDGTQKSRIYSKCALPTWSPNGDYIACISWALIILDTHDGSGKILTESIPPTFVSWSPDSQQIVYSKYNDNADTSTIYKVAIDHPREPIKLTDSVKDSNPQWSPDGTKILFSSARGGQNQIFIMDANGSHQKPITDGSALDFDAVWSPNGKKIAFVSLRDADNIKNCTNSAIYTCNNSEIYIMNTDGSDQVRVTNYLGADWDPTWSPDGQSIAFISYRDEPNIDKCDPNCNSEIYLLNLVNGKVTRLTNNKTPDFGPLFWQPHN